MAKITMMQYQTAKINEAVVDVVVSDVDGCKLGAYCCSQQMSALCPAMMPSFLNWLNEKAWQQICSRTRRLTS